MGYGATILREHNQIESHFWKALKVIKIAWREIKRTAKETNTTRLLVEKQSQETTGKNTRIKNCVGTVHEVFDGNSEIGESHEKKPGGAQFHNEGKGGHAKSTVQYGNPKLAQDCAQELMSQNGTPFEQSRRMGQKPAADLLNDVRYQEGTNENGDQDNSKWDSQRGERSGCESRISRERGTEYRTTQMDAQGRVLRHPADD